MMLNLPFMILAIEDEEDRLFMEQLYQTYGKLMIRCAFRVLRDLQDANDAMGQALVIMIENLQRLQRVESSRLRPYIIAMVRNISINMAVKRSRESKYAFAAGDDVLNQIPSPDAKPEEVALGDFQADLLIRAIKQLPENERAIIDMKYLSRASDQEIGRALRLAPSSVRVYLTRARRRLYEIMRGQMNEE